MIRVRTAAESFFERRSAAGMVFAALAYQQSLTPSLLPRGGVAQGVVSGLSVVLVYLLVTGIVRLGAALGLTPEMVSDHLPEIRRWTGWGAVLALPVFLAFSIPGRQAEWQTLGYDVADRLGYVGVLVVAVVVLLIGALVVWGCRRLYARVLRGVRVVVPLGIASAIAVVVTGLVVVLAVNELAYGRFMDAINSSREGADSDVGEVAPPADAAVSGSPASLVTWASLGRDGRSFIQRRPTAAAITEIAPTAAIDPIRIFIGRQAADTHAERAALALAELERTEAFERDVLMLVAPTGAGWVDEQVVQPVEYFYAGDVATVAVQYSHLPSPIAFLSEQDAAIESSRALYEAVTDRLAALPEADRPLFLVTGESLGAFGGTGVFDNLDALVRRTDGSMWVGTPPMSGLRREAERRREAGSPQVRPVVADLPEVVFGARPEDFAGTAATHAFLQFADDPIVWWDSGLLLRRPDWLREPLDPQVAPDLGWRPVTTFLQLTADMAVGNAFGEGFGHKYGTLPLEAWHSMLRPEGWDQARVGALRSRLDAAAEMLR